MAALDYYNPPPGAPPAIVPALSVPVKRKDYVPHQLLLQHALRHRQKKLGGTHGDSALLNWIIAIGIVIAAIVTIVFARNFLDAFAKARRRELLDYNTQYRLSQVSKASESCWRGAKLADLTETPR